MNWNEHSDLEGKHALLSPSQYAWSNYSPDKLRSVMTSKLAILRGTELHAFAAEAIRLGINLPKNNTTLSLYVNDAIGYKMTPEKTLFYSYNCFGTADAICFRRKKLRIHDLKTGKTPASMTQLEIYAALFCLEYGYKPKDISIELRIYQSNQVLVHEPEYEDIEYRMNSIIVADKIVDLIHDGDIEELDNYIKFVKGGE